MRRAGVTQAGVTIVPPPVTRRASSLVVAAVLCLAFAGAAHALSVDIVRPDTDPAEVYPQVRIWFEAVAQDEQGNDVTDRATFTWSFPEAKGPTVGNPVLHRFPEVGKFLVSVTATLDRDSGGDETTVIVIPYEGNGLLQFPEAPAREDFTFTARRGEHVFDTDVCDEVSLTIEHLVEGYQLPFEWVVARFYRWEDDDWVLKQNGPPDGQIATYPWTSTLDPNEDEVLWWAHVELDEVGAEPPNTVAFDYFEGWTPDNTVVKATGDPPIILHKTTDTSHTIPWTITHCSDLTPNFIVTVTICDLAGNTVATLTDTDATVGAGGAVWDTNLPEENGIYTYKIHARHYDEPGEPFYDCIDDDKSSSLQISDVSHSDFEWIEPPTEAQVTLHYELNREAGQCHLAVYNHNLEQVTVVSPAGGVLNADVGPHSVVVVFEDANEGVGRYRFVVSAEETAQDGQLNRDGQPKPALQKGANYTSPFSANFGMNGEFGDLGNYGQYAQDHVEAARQAQRSRGFGPWEDSEKQVPADAVGINADHARRAVSEVKVFSFYGHGIVYPNDPGNDGNAVVTRQRTWPLRDGALATTAAVAQGLSDDYVAYGLVDAPEWTAQSYSGTWMVCIFACRSHKTANSIAAYLKNTVGVPHAAGFSRTMHSWLGSVYGEQFWTHFQQYQWIGTPWPADQVRECAQDAVVSFWAYVDANPSDEMAFALEVSDGLDRDINPFFVVADNYHIDRGTMQQWP